MPLCLYVHLLLYVGVQLCHSRLENMGAHFRLVFVGRGEGRGRHSGGRGRYEEEGPQDFDRRSSR